MRAGCSQFPGGINQRRLGPARLHVLFVMSLVKQCRLKSMDHGCKILKTRCSIDMSGCGGIYSVQNHTLYDLEAGHCSMPRRLLIGQTLVKTPVGEPFESKPTERTDQIFASSASVVDSCHY